MDRPPSIVLSDGGVALALAFPETGAPVITHWGAAAGLTPEAGDELAVTAAPAVMRSSFDEPRLVSALPGQQEGWSGTPALELHRGRMGAFPRLVLTDLTVEPASAHLRLEDAGHALAVELAYAVDRFGVLRATAEVSNDGQDDLEIEAVRLLLPLPVRAGELLDLTGRWSGERRPQRGPLLDGTRSRATRRGRPGHDAPLLEIAGTPGFGFRSGEVWAAHVAWSGDTELLVERLPEGVGALSALLGGGELLAPGELVLAPGERYRTPEVLFVWSDAGLDGLSERLHGTVRAFPTHPSRPRPLVLNTWEAVYFEHDLERLSDLATTAQAIGVERFVLDDGWFQGRRDDTIGLGDWTVDPAVWPQGLEPLARHVQGLGMELGLWVEPEMVNPGSTVALEHPDWLLAADPLGPSWRHQYVLNVAHPDAFAYLLEHIDVLVRDLGLAFLKWDHNRDLHEPVDRRTGAAGVHAQTLATYALMDELQRRNPGLEIESCASGGARVDLGVLQRTQRVWTSDTNDAIERQAIQRWTGLLVPPELVGAHVGPARAHTTDRELDLSFRLLTALFGHAGIEWDISACTEEELERLRAWAALYKRVRPLIATGVTVRADHVPDGSLLHGVVAPDRRRALLAWVQTAAGAPGTTERVPLPGVDPALRYRVELREELGPVARRSAVDPPWLAAGSAELAGAVLSVGVPLPALQPGQGVLLELTAVDARA